MPIPAAFLKKGRKKPAKGGAAEEGMESTKMEKGESPEYGDAPHGKGKKPCAACMKKGKKSGSCGCAAKAAMDAVLTPMEYLDACELGIHRRSRGYIRGVLSVREDKKCGRSGIAEGKKCNKGVLGTVKSALGNENVQTGLKVAAVAGGIAAGTVGAMKYRGMRQKVKDIGRTVGKFKATRGKISAKLGATKKANSTYWSTGSALNVKTAQIEAKGYRNNLREYLGDLKKEAPISAARRRRANKGGN
jgi:hypothetical protein